MIWKKYHFFNIWFTVGPKSKHTKAEKGVEYSLTVKVEDLLEIQAHLEAAYDAKSIRMKSIIEECVSLTDAEKAALVIDRL